MKPARTALALTLGVFLLTAPVAWAAPGDAPTSATTAVPASATQWTRGLPADPAYFPIAVWLQSPANAERYKAAGINLYIGLWDGPTQRQIDELKMPGMPVICSQNAWAIRHLDEATIVGWMHGDEPDNAQSLADGWPDLAKADIQFSVNGSRFGSYGPPVPPSQIVSDYRRIAAVDPTRPVLLNLGQAVAWDNYPGRGTRSRHPEDYPEYVRGCDIASFDIYPVVHDSPEVAGKLWFVADGVRRLRGWAGDARPVWNCIECTRISSRKVKPTPHDVRAEVWMSLIHGSTGLVYFAHEWEPKFTEAGLLADAEMLQAVTAINRRIAALAPVLHAPTDAEAVSVSFAEGQGPIAWLTKRGGDILYVFAVEMRGTACPATFAIRGAQSAASVEVLDENRRMPAPDGVFADTFQPYDVHLYAIGPQR